MAIDKNLISQLATADRAAAEARHALYDAIQPARFLGPRDYYDTLCVNDDGSVCIEYRDYENSSEYIKLTPEDLAADDVYVAHLAREASEAARANAVAQQRKRAQEIENLKSQIGQLTVDERKSLGL